MIRRRVSSRGVPLQHLLSAIQQEGSTDCFIWPYAKTSGGYGAVMYEGRMWAVHRLACQLVYGPPPEPNMMAAHGPCHNRACFNPAHVRWASPQENQIDRLRDGTHYFGEGHHNAHFTEKEIAAVRERHARGESLVSIADEFDVTPQAIYRIVNRLSWKHVA